MNLKVQNFLCLLKICIHDLGRWGWFYDRGRDMDRPVTCEVTRCTGRSPGVLGRQPCTGRSASAQGAHHCKANLSLLERKRIRGFPPSPKKRRRKKKYSLAAGRGNQRRNKVWGCVRPPGGGAGRVLKVFDGGGSEAGVASSHVCRSLVSPGNWGRKVYTANMRTDVRHERKQK